MKKFLMLSAAAMVAGAVRAATETVDGMTYTYTVSGGAATITKAEGDNKSVTIPSTLGGATVTTLAGNSFNGNTIVMKVAIPESVTKLGALYNGGAFQDCVSLTTCNIPSGVNEIPNNCFSGCIKLRNIILPQGLTRIGAYAFWKCGSLDTIEFPSGLESINGYAFGYCSGLKRIVVPETVKSVGTWCFAHCSALLSVRLPLGLTRIESVTFQCCYALRQVNIPEGVTYVGDCAFTHCGSLYDMVVPATVTTIEDNSFTGVPSITFRGAPPNGFVTADISAAITYPKEYGSLWQSCLSVNRLGGYVNPNKPVVTIVSSGVRANAPTILDVVYKVTSKKPTVKVRALAFEDGERSLAKVTRPETFVADTNGVATAGSIGDAIAANVEHTLSWQVSSDFKTDLAKMKFEVLAVEDDILPLEFITIPANGSNKAMELSWNLMTESQVFDALLWLYAAKTEGLTLTSGVLKNGTTQLASGTSISTSNAISYSFTKMGYSVLSGTNLTYANDMTRMGLSPSGIRQYAYRWIEEK